MKKIFVLTTQANLTVIGREAVVKCTFYPTNLFGDNHYEI